MTSAVSVRCSADWEKQGLSEPVSQWVTALPDVTVMWGWSRKRLRELQLDTDMKPPTAWRRTPDVSRNPNHCILPLFTSLFPVPRPQASGSVASIIQETPQTKTKQAHLAPCLQPPSCRESWREETNKHLVADQPETVMNDMPVPIKQIDLGIFSPQELNSVVKNHRAS